MTQPPTPPLLCELRNPASLTTQIRALRQLKNEIIGHEQNKQTWIGLGVLTPLTRILNSFKGEGKRRAHSPNVEKRTQLVKEVRTDQEEARLQAVIIVGSLASGGPAFVPPLHACHTIPPLLALLSLVESSPQTVVQSLRALNNFVDALSLATPEQDTARRTLLDLLYNEHTLRNLSALLLQKTTIVTTHQQITLICSLISKTCQEDYHRRCLVDFGILEALAAQLASWISYTLSTSDTHSASHSSCQLCLGRSKLSSVLQATGVIVQHSRFRAQRLLNASPIVRIFQTKNEQLRISHGKHSEKLPAGIRAMARMPDSCVDLLLPVARSSQSRIPNISTAGYPPLDAIRAMNRSWPKSISTSVDFSPSPGLQPTRDAESPLVAWLIYVVRISDEVTSLMAMWLLGNLYRQDLVKKDREISIALLIIPPLVRMLDIDLRKAPNTLHPFDDSVLSPFGDTVKQEAPAVLAMLTVNNERTQKAAVDAGAIKKLAQLLKDSYDPVNASATSSMWSADPSKPSASLNEDETSRLGLDGVLPTDHYTAKVKETTLVALAALASKRDEYRKAIIENGVIPYVIRSLKAGNVNTAGLAHPKTANREDMAQITTYGTCREAVLSACGTIRALSRSVASLRTSLMNAGLAAPLFALLQCHDMELKIAATAVVCNLVMEYSPVRETMLEAGILKVLCDHARSENANLRINSLWALKHLVVQASTSLKIECMETLRLSWLKQVIGSDHEIPTTSRVGDRDDGNETPIRMSTPNAAGEQVDLLNAVQEASRESSGGPETDGDEDLKMSDSIGSLSKGEEDDKAHSTPTTARPTLHVPSSRNPQYHELDLPDEIAIVKQGLEFLRNIMLGDNLPEMVDYVFGEMGQDDLFRILTSKMRPKVLNAFNRDRRSTENNGIRHIQPPTEILVTVVYILVHIAASSQSRHRQLLVNQPKVLEQVVALFNHHNAEIRSSCAWLVHNLIWDDDSSEKAGCRERARKLMDLGFYQKLREMESDDPIVDCKERAKAAVHTMSTLMRG